MPATKTKPAAKATAKKTAAKKAPAKKAAADKPAAATKSLKAGDKVEWSISGGKSVGKVVRKTTTTTKVKGHVAKASAAEPQFEVRSEKSGKMAVHKPGELRKRK